MSSWNRKPTTRRVPVTKAPKIVPLKPAPVLNRINKFIVEGNYNAAQKLLKKFYKNPPICFLIS